VPFHKGGCDRTANESFVDSSYGGLRQRAAGKQVFSTLAQDGTQPQSLLHVSLIRREQIIRIALARSNGPAMERIRILDKLACAAATNSLFGVQEINPQGVAEKGKIVT